jgi:hypothetical protein
MNTEERLESLEREVARAKRRNRWVLAAVGLGALAWAMMGAAPASGPSPQAVPVGKSGPAADKIADPQPGPVGPKVIRANKFIVEDADGKERATLDVIKNMPLLCLYDENGGLRVQLFASKVGPAMILVDENGGLRAELCAYADAPALRLFDENKKPRANLSATTVGPVLELCDEKGKLRAGLGVAKRTTPDGRTIIYPESSLFLCGPDGKEIWKAP